MLIARSRSRPMRDDGETGNRRADGTSAPVSAGPPSAATWWSASSSPAGCSWAGAEGSCHRRRPARGARSLPHPPPCLSPPTARLHGNGKRRYGGLAMARVVAFSPRLVAGGKEDSRPLALGRTRACLQPSAGSVVTGRPCPS
jgi:hypothetical protein